MARQQGIVTKVHGQFIDVVARRPKACENCGACRLADVKPKPITAINDVGADVGEWVELELDSGHMLRAVALAYGVPLLAFFVGLLSGEAIFESFGLHLLPSLAAAIGGFIFLVIGYYIVHLYDRSLSVGAFMSTAVAIVESTEECPSVDKLHSAEGDK